MIFIRNPLSATRSLLVWYVPNVFDAGKMRDIVASYDGSDANVYVDGNRVPQSYRLGPGTTLLRSIVFIRTPDLGGCVFVYETLVFLPAGLLLGTAAGKWARQENYGRWMLVLGLVLPAVLLEILLAGVSGRRIWAANIALSLAFGLAGMLLINADRLAKNSSHGTKACI